MKRSNDHHHILVGEFQFQSSKLALEYPTTTSGQDIRTRIIGDHHVGGNDELQAANKSGELDKLLA